MVAAKAKKLDGLGVQRAPQTESWKVLHTRSYERKSRPETHDMLLCSSGDRGSRGLFVSQFWEYVDIRGSNQ